MERLCFQERLTDVFRSILYSPPLRLFLPLGWTRVISNAWKMITFQSQSWLIWMHLSEMNPPHLLLEPLFLLFQRSFYKVKYIWLIYVYSITIFFSLRNFSNIPKSRMTRMMNLEAPSPPSFNKYSCFSSFMIHFCPTC